MKNALSLFLVIAVLAAVFCGCSGGSDDKGAEIPVYISDQVLNFDPAYAYTDDAAVKIMPLIYEGLTRIDSDGKVKNALLDSYTYNRQEDGTYMLECTLRTTCWSDGITVSADDFVYAIKRIMDPEFSSEASCLLYQLKNAAAVKSGDASIDDLGVRAADASILQFIFDEDIDVDVFLETLASPALYPLRERVVTTVDNWSSTTQLLVSNGPFYVKQAKEGKSLVLERSQYYYRDVNKDKLDKSVTPYRLIINFSADKDLYSEDESITSNELAQMAMLAAEEKYNSIVYNSDIALEKRGETKTTSIDMLTQHVYYFNTDNELFKDPEVRKALSLAIDRNAIVDIVKYAAASEGMIPSGVYADSARKTDYREKYGSLISASADVDTAKSMLRSAKVTKGSFDIKCKNSPVEKAIAEYVADVWGDLGFKVSVKTMGYKTLSASLETMWYDLYSDRLADALKNKDFDVIAIDYTPKSTYAWASLAQFATGYTGAKISLKDITENPDYTPDTRHITGWQNDGYDKLISEAASETDMSAKSDKLAEAEKILMDEMPVMPLITYKNSYTKTSALKGLSEDYYGAVIFTKAKLKGYKDYIAPATEETEGN